MILRAKVGEKVVKTRRTRRRWLQPFTTHETNQILSVTNVTILMMMPSLKMMLNTLSDLMTN